MMHCSDIDQIFADVSETLIWGGGLFALKEILNLVIDMFADRFICSCNDSYAEHAVI